MYLAAKAYNRHTTGNWHVYVPRSKSLQPTHYRKLACVRTSQQKPTTDTLQETGMRTYLAAKAYNRHTTGNWHAYVPRSKSLQPTHYRKLACVRTSQQKPTTDTLQETGMRTYLAAKAYNRHTTGNWHAYVPRSKSLQPTHYRKLACVCTLQQGPTTDTLQETGMRTYLAAKAYNRHTTGNWHAYVPCSKGLKDGIQVKVESECSVDGSVKQPDLNQQRHHFLCTHKRTWGRTSARVFAR